VKKVLAVVVVMAGCTGLMMQPALAKHRYHHHWGHGGNAAMGGNNGNSASGSNSAVNIKGGNNGLGR
jgi:hypothetical protein